MNGQRSEAEFIQSKVADQQICWIIEKFELLANRKSNGQARRSCHFDNMRPMTCFKSVHET